MISRNEIKIIGNIGSNPITREANGIKSVNFPVATSENWTTKDGEQKSSTQWHKIVLHGNLCDIADLLKTGMSVCIFGKIRTYQWQDNGEDRTAVKVIAQSVFIGINEMRKIKNRTSTNQDMTVSLDGTHDPDAHISDGKEIMDQETNFDDLPF